MSPWPQHQCLVFMAFVHPSLFVDAALSWFVDTAFLSSPLLGPASSQWLLVFSWFWEAWAYLRPSLCLSKKEETTFPHLMGHEQS